MDQGRDELDISTVLVKYISLNQIFISTVTSDNSQSLCHCNCKRRDENQLQFWLCCITNPFFLLLLIFLFREKNNNNKKRSDVHQQDFVLEIPLDNCESCVIVNLILNLGLCPVPLADCPQVVCIATIYLSFLYFWYGQQKGMCAWSSVFFLLWWHDFGE